MANLCPHNTLIISAAYTCLNCTLNTQGKSSGHNQRKVAFSAGDISSDLAKYNQLRVGMLTLCDIVLRSVLGKSSGRLNRANQRKVAFSAGDISSDLAKYNQLRVRALTLCDIVIVLSLV